MSNLINLLGLKSILVTIIIVSACEGCLPLREKIINSWEISLGVRKSKVKYFMCVLTSRKKIHFNELFLLSKFRLIKGRGRLGDLSFIP